MTDETQPQCEMPKYTCHKEVWALKIAAAEIHKDGSVTIMPAGGYAKLMLPPEWGVRFKPSDTDPGYYVVYQDGFQSWSPSEAFENGYTLISGE